MLIGMAWVNVHAGARPQGVFRVVFCHVYVSNQIRVQIMKDPNGKEHQMPAAPYVVKRTFMKVFCGHYWMFYSAFPTRDYFSESFLPS